MIQLHRPQNNLTTALDRQFLVLPAYATHLEEDVFNVVFVGTAQTIRLPYVDVQLHIWQGIRQEFVP